MDFNTTAKRLADDLREAFPVLDDDDVAAIIGNGAHESGGFRTLQEIKPVVAGSAGGWGFFQWTAARRRAFDAWAAKRGFKRDSYEANAGFLIYELKTSEAGAIGNTRRAKGLSEKVKAFEMGYERAGVKHYDSRIRWAQKAKAVIGKREPEAPEVEQRKPEPPKPVSQSTTIWGAIIAWLTANGFGWLSGVFAADWKTVLAIGAVLSAAATGWVIYQRWLKAKVQGV